jgi:hypothetical protein
MVLQPIVSLDKVWVEAAYPAVLRSRIEPVLETEIDVIRGAATKMKFGNVAESSELSRGRQRRAVSRAERSSDHLAAMAGRFAGGFVSEFLN